MGALVSPSLQNLIVSVRTMLKQPDPTNSFWKDEELKMYINEAIRICYAEMSHLVEGHFTTSTNLNIVANVETVDLPTDFFEVKNVYKKVNNDYIAMPYLNNLNMDFSGLGVGSSTSYAPSYYFQGNTLVLRPIPNFSETAGLRLEYIQFPATLVNGGDTLTANISPIFKQVIEMYAVFKAKLVESMVSGVAMHQIPEAHFNTLFRSFKDAVERRSHGQTYIQAFNPEC